MIAPNYLTKKDLEERWGVSGSMIYRMCKAGQLEKQGGRGKLGLFACTAIEQWEVEHPVEFARFQLRKAKATITQDSRQNEVV